MVFDPAHPIHDGLPESDPVRDNFVALAEHHRGGMAPPSPQIGYIWLDTSSATNWKLKQYTQDAPAAAQWVTLLEHLEASPSAPAHASSHTSGADQLPNSSGGDVLRHDTSQWQAVSDHSDFDYLVGPVDKARFQTVQGAVDQAFADGHDNDNPARIGIFQGTYTEDITLSAGIFLEAIKIPGYAGYPAAADLVEIVGSITFDHSAVTGTWYVVGLRGINVSTSTGVSISFTGTADKRMCIDECYIATSHSTSVVLSLGTSKIDIPCNNSVFSGISGSVPAVVLSTDQTLSMFFSAIIGNPSYDSVTIDGGTFYFRGPDSMALGSYLYGKVHVLTGSTGSKVQVYNVRIWVVTGDHFTIDGTVAVGDYEGALDFSAATPATVSGTNAASFKELPAASAGEVRQFDGNRWQLVQLSPRVICTTEDIKAILEAATDGSSFWLEDGTHTITDVITISSKKAISIFGGAGAVVTRAGASELFVIEGCEDLSLVGFTLSVPNVYGNIIDISGASSGSYQHPVRHRYLDLHIDSPDTSGDAPDAIYCTDGFKDGIIARCRFTGRLYACVEIFSTGAYSLEGTIILGNQMRTVEVGGGAAIEVRSNTDRGVVIAANSIIGPFSRGIRVNDTENAIVAKNYIQDTDGYGIWIGNSSMHAQVFGNSVFNSGNDGIRVDEGNAIISHNFVHTTTSGHGIHCNTEDLCNVAGNYVEGAVGDGIHFTAQTSSVASGNVLVGNGGFGILLDATSNENKMVGNIFSGNTSGTYSNSGTDNEIDGKVENTVQTTGATTPTIATIPIPDDTSVLIDVSVNAFRTNGDDQVAYKKAALVYRRSAGVATLEGAVQDVMPDIESDVNFDATIAVSGNNAIVTVTGVAVKTMEWKSRHTTEAAG